MAYNFQIQAQIQVSSLITDIHTTEVTLYHLDDYTVKYDYRIFRTDTTSGERVSSYTHREILSNEVYETLLEAENAYHVLCLKGFVRLNQIDKNSDLTNLEQEKGY
jgi:hypothetical protein